MAWKYTEPTKRTFDVLPEGDYSCTVLECSGLEKSKTGKDMITVKLDISGKHVWYRPWSGKTKDGDVRDNISEFLKAVNKVPKGEMNWQSVVGAKGKCRIKHGEYNGDVTNEVGWFYVPRTTRPANPDADKGQSISADEFQKLREQQEKQIAGDEVDPDSISY
jgi:hypothetical protein